MALNVSLSLVDASVIAGRPTTFLVTVANTSASSVTLNSLAVAESTESDAIISQPNFLTPQVALGVGNPTIGASSSVSYTFKVVFPSPNTPGPSPSTPIGVAGAFSGQPPVDSSFVLQASASASDGSVGSASLSAATLSSIAPFPPVATGTLQLQFQPGFNVVGGLVLGLL